MSITSPPSSFRYDEPQGIACGCKKTLTHKSLTLAMDRIQASAFGSKEWLRYFGVKTQELCLSKDLFNFLLAPDVFDSNKKNYETHLPPILCPQFINTVIATDKKKPFEPTNTVISTPYNHQALAMLSNLEQPERSIYKLIDKTQSEPPCWLVVRKELLFRESSAQEQIESMKKLNADTAAHYEILPSALQIATILLVNHVVSGKCFFANLDHSKSVSLCQDKILQKANAPTHVGCFCDNEKAKKFRWNGLIFESYRFPSDHIGVMAVQKFMDYYPPTISDGQNEECDGWVLVPTPSETFDKCKDS